MVGRVDDCASLLNSNLFNRGHRFESYTIRQIIMNSTRISNVNQIDKTKRYYQVKEQFDGSLSVCGMGEGAYINQDLINRTLEFGCFFIEAGPEFNWDAMMDL